MSIALVWAGVVFPRIHFTWRHRRRNKYFPVRASDYLLILANKELLSGDHDEKRELIRNRKGVIYFGGGFNNASGHLTVWNGQRLHYPRKDEGYWTQPIVAFWEMTG